MKFDFSKWQPQFLSPFSKITILKINMLIIIKNYGKKIGKSSNTIVLLWTL